MAKKQQLTRDDLARLFNDSRLDVVSKHKIITDQLHITGIEATLDGDALVDAVFAKYQAALAEVEAKQKAAALAAPVKAATAKTTEAKAAGEPSRKDIIIDVLAKAKTMATSELIKAIDAQCGYAERGKSSRTRVNRVIRDLVAEGKAEEADGKVTYKG